MGPFRSKLSETVFVNKYKHEGCNTWYDLAKTLVNDVCRDRMTNDEKGELIQYISDMKFIPGGRYLYYAGRPTKFFNNCGSYDTRVLTDKGWVKMGENVGQTLNVFSPVDGEYYPAEFNEHGKQVLNEITFVPVRGKSKIEYKVRFTKNHRWLLSDGSDTYDLRIGDVVPANTMSFKEDDLGFVHGFMFGDGCSNGRIRLCGQKTRNLNRISQFGKVTKTEDNGDIWLSLSNDYDWKNLPDSSKTPEYISSFIKGWIEADGCQDRIINSVTKDHLVWFADHCAFAGLVVSGALRSQVRDVKIGQYEYKDHEIFIQNFSYGDAWAGFKVKSIVEKEEEVVYCPFEPVHNRIVIDHGIDTYQCFLLKAEEDTREDWAMKSWQAESCLMTGGGIGIDYSIYRDSKRTLSKTGGMASGPIPKMFMINEIGRNVMQGGSRRSAIYASLNWKHGDIQEFLVAKDWHNMPVAGTNDLTVWDLKNADFNYKAPLDMTNISVNYDTEWWLNYKKTGDVGDVFRKNVEQALKTGEPGFSFNFFDKEKETLRNACCEVSSEDDSDVCNLGSINISRISSLDELRDVVELATKFLLCGTLVADLPYDKVDEVRKKNRRLGLGMMGIHEWLLKRGYKYEVVDELKDWLAVYRGASDSTSKDFAKVLEVSTPVANRAIAPTGTIGILAGTTTGIEPIYAVAYKRRYLTNGTKWKHQYAVDSTAEILLNEGIKEENIETAVDLAKDYERRIKFQAEVQEYVDMAISSTINLPAYDESALVDTNKFASTLASYASKLRGFTCYPDGARGGQPITSVPYADAKDKLGEEFEDHIEDNDSCKGGVCGL